MWTCPKCERVFKTANQSHSCVPQDLGILFLDKPDHLVLAFDGIMSAVLQWEPNAMGASKNAIVFTNKKAWLIVRPMSKELDLKIYYDEIIPSPLVKKTTEYRGKHAHHIRIKEEIEITPQLLALLRKGFEFALR